MSPSGLSFLILVMMVTSSSVFPPPTCDALRLEGTWETDSFFLFLTKFGFQKTVPSNKNETQGYIFGNITSATESTWVISAPLGKRLVKRESAVDSGLVPKNPVVVSSSNSKSLSSTPKPSTLPITKPLLPSILSPSTGSNQSTSSSAKKPGNLLNSSGQKPPLINASTSSTTTTTTAKPSSTTAASPSPGSSSTRASRPTTKSTPITPPVIKVFPATLVVLDRGYFVDFYRNRNNPDKDEACRLMFEHISHVAYDSICYKDGTEHYIKRIPCPKGELCPDDASNTSYVVKENQFTYAISDPNQPKFWYVSLVACYRDPLTCEWRHSGKAVSVNYDIWLVNGNPYTKNQNPLEYQFSFDRQDTVEIYLAFFMCYLILFPLQVHAVLRQRHIVPRLFTSSVTLELTAVLANVIHVLKFSMNGIGHPSLAAFGDIMDIAARAIFMLILLVLAKGWAVTRTELTSKPFIFTIWTIYLFVAILLYVWKETEVDVIEDIDEYQTWPGWLILVLRNVIMIWFLYELKDTMDHEHHAHKLNFFLHFGAASLVWFIYLPIIALIALQVTPLWRSKLILGITYAADCLAFAVMTHLLWPTRSQQYFLLTAKDISLNDELEEFNEAPHVINSYSRRSNHRQQQPGFFHSRDSDSLARSNHFNENSANGSMNSIYDDYKDNTPLIIT